MSTQIVCLKLKCCIVLFALLLTGLLLGQSVFVLAQSTGLGIQWSKTYGSGGASWIIQTQGGDFMIAGANTTRLTTGVFTMYNYTTLLIKTNSAGEVEWTKYYPKINGSVIIMQTVDLGYLLLNCGSEIYSSGLWKMDSQGNVEWNRPVDLQQIMGFTAVEDGSYVIVGYADNPTTAYCYAVVLKYNSNGDLLWQKTFQGDKINVAATVILQSNDEKSHYFAGSWDQSFWFVKLDSYGNIVWNHTYNYQDASGVSPLTFHSIAQTQDNGYILAGTDGKYGWLIKTDSEGNEQWHQRYDFPYFVSVAQKNNGQYIVLDRFQLCTVDASGNLLWSKNYSVTGNFDTPSPNSTTASASSCTLTNDGGFAVAGAIYYPYNETSSIWVAKFAPEPNNPDSPVPYTLLLGVTIVVAVVVAIGLLVYLKKYKR